ncbi:hypothetical protein TW85_11165 [Marinomonas sp. S3726]|nr:hypothetical protein TW85_11165 [Marinomonas sp. S3726]
MLDTLSITLVEQSRLIRGDLIFGSQGNYLGFFCLNVFVVNSEHIYKNSLLTVFVNYFHPTILVFYA